MASIEAKPDVRTFLINQATTKTFRELYVEQTMIVLVQSGSKRVRQSNGEAIEILPGGLLIFPAGTFITIENRIISGVDYAAYCVSYPDSYLEGIFQAIEGSRKNASAIHLDPCPQDLALLLRELESLSADKVLPEEVRRHRMLEPLVWLRALGIALPIPHEKTLDCRLRDLLSADPAHKWRSQEVASQMGFSEATFRRKLQKCGATFSSILMNVRLELGLTLLQTTQLPISQIALDCGFATPSHFSDSFKARFDLQPKSIRKNTC